MMRIILFLTMFLVEFLPTTGSELGQCKLSMVPTESPKVGKSGCWSFYNTLKSRLEYNVLQTCGESPTKLSFQFRSPAHGGVLFYVSDEKHVHFLSIVMFSGHLVFGVNCDSGPTIVWSRNKYNDGNWHSVLVFLNKTQIPLLAIDSEKNPKAEELTIFCNTTSSDKKPLLFVGGIGDALRENDAVKNSLSNATHSFGGYLRNATLDDKPLGKASKSVDIGPCYEDIETGLFLTADGGLLTIKFMNLDEEGMNISMEIKPRHNSGIILVMTGDQDTLLLLETVDGAVKLSVYNGDEEVQAVYVPSMKYAICDGQWHIVNVSVEDNNKITLCVDNSTLLWNNVAGVASTKNFTTMYFGGYLYPDNLRGTNNTSNFVGCMRNVDMNPKPTLLSSNIAGNFHPYICPVI